MKNGGYIGMGASSPYEIHQGDKMYKSHRDYPYLFSNHRQFDEVNRLNRHQVSENFDLLHHKPSPYHQCLYDEDSLTMLHFHLHSHPKIWCLKHGNPQHYHNRGYNLTIQQLPLSKNFFSL